MLTREVPPVVSMFLQALPPKPLEIFKLPLTSPRTLAALPRFGAGAIAPATKTLRAYARFCAR